MTRAEYDRLYGTQQISISEVTQALDNIPDVEIINNDYDDIIDIVPIKKSIIIPKIKDEPAVKSKTPTVQIVQSKPTPSVEPFKPQKKTMDLFGLKVGVVVKHKTFGNGTVRKLEGELIVVSFGTAEKKFQFPQAFEGGFLQIKR